MDTVHACVYGRAEALDCLAQQTKDDDMGRKFTIDDIEAAVFEGYIKHQNGLTADDIAKEVGCSASTVYKLLREDPARRVVVLRCTTLGSRRGAIYVPSRSWLA